VIEHRAMGVGLTEIVRPGVDMSVEMDERQRPLAARQRPQQGQRDAVLAARMAAGPNRAPLRLVVPMSNGIPATQIGDVGSRLPTPRKLAGTA